MLRQLFRFDLIRFGLFLGLVSTLVVTEATAQSHDPVTEIMNARKIYVPIEDLEVVIERDKQGVILPRAQFDAMLAAAKENREKNPVPTGEAVLISNAEYAAKIAGDQLLLNVTAEWTQFDSGWHETRFPLQRLSLEQVQIDDVPAFAGRHPDGSISLFTNARGKHRLKLQLSTELNSQGSDQVAACSLIPSASAALTLTLPVGKRLFLGGLQLERPSPLDQVADYRVAVGGMSGLQLRITDRATENAADSLTFATTGYGLNVAPGEVTWHAVTTMQLFGKPVDRLTFVVPNQLEITEVESTGLEAWALADDPTAAGHTSISLTYGQAFEGARKVSLKGVMAVPAGSAWAVPPLNMSGATSQIGQITIRQSAGVRTQVTEAVGVRREAATAVTASEEVTQYSTWQPDFVLRLTTQPKQREVQSAVATVIDVNSTGLEIQSAVTLMTHFAPLFEVDIRLPFEWQVVSVQKGDQMLRWQLINLEEPGQTLLRILLDTPLATDSSGEFRLALRRDVEGWPVETQPVIVTLPDLFLPQSSLTEGAVVIRGDDDLELAAFDLQGMAPRPLKAAFERLRFETQDGHINGKLKITRKPSRIAVQTITVGRIDPQTTHAFLQAEIEVQGGGVRTLKVALPEATGTAIRFESPSVTIVEQKSAAPQNGERIWTLQFDQRLRGQSLLICDIEMPRTEGGDFRFPQWRFVEADRQNGYFAIEAGAEQRLTITANEASGTPLFEVDPLELPSTSYRAKERIVAVYRSVAPGATMTIGEQKLGKLPVPSAVCPLLEVATILGRTGELQQRATFHLNVTGVQGLHVLFPAGTTLWATLVDGLPVEVRRNGDVYLVPLVAITPPTMSSDHATVPSARERLVQFFYRSEVSAISSFGKIEQRPPTLTVESALRTALPVEILEQKWDVHHPPETQLVESHGPLEPHVPFESVSLLGTWIAGVHPPTILNVGGALLTVLITVGVVLLLRSGTRDHRPIIAAIAIGGVFAVIWLTAFTTSKRMLSHHSKSSTNHLGFTFGEADPMAKAMMPEAAPVPPDGKPVPPALEGAVAKNDKGPALPIGQPAPAIGGKPMPETRGTTDRRGLMSLAIDFAPPANTLRKTFGYVGADSPVDGIPLEVEYVDAQTGGMTRLFVIALCATAAWFLRKVNLLTQIRIATFGFVLPLSLVAFAPISWQLLLDGLFLGTFAAVLVWLLCYGVCCCTCTWAAASSNGVRKSAVAIILLGALVNVSFAEEKHAGSVADDPGETSSLTIPYQTDTEPLASQRVFLSHEQFRLLYRLANPDKPGLDSAPHAGGIVEAFYVARLHSNTQTPDSSLIEVKARYAVRSLASGQSIADLPIKGVAVREAKLDGRPAALIARERGFQVAIADPGVHVLDLTFDIPVRLSGAIGSFTLPLTPVTAGTLSFELPSKDLSVRVNGSSTVFRRVTQDATQLIELPIDKGGDLAISWQPEQSHDAAAAVIQVDSVQTIALTDAGCAVSQAMSYRIRQGGVADLSVNLPEPLRLQSVSGPDVGGWELIGEGATRKLRIIFRRQITDQTRVTIDAFFDAKVLEPATAIALPQMTPLEISNEIGQIAIFADDQFSLRADQIDSLSQIDSERFTTNLEIKRPKVAPRLAYRFSKRPYTLTLRATRQEPQAHVVALDAAFISAQKQQLTSRFHFELTGAPRSSISIALPTDFVLLDVQATKMRDWYIGAQEGESHLTVELTEPQLGNIDVDVNGFVPRDSALASIQFPFPLDVTRMESTSAVWLDEGLSGVIDSSEGWRSIDASQIDAGLRAVRSQQAAQFAFTSSQVTPAPVAMRLTPASPKFAADSLSMVTVTDLSVVYTLAMQWQIEAARTDTLTVTTSKWLAGKLDFQGEGIRETTFVDAGNDRTRWTIHLRAPINGKYFVTAIAAMSAPGTEVQAPAIAFEREQAAINPQRHYVLLINSSSSQLNTVDASSTRPAQPEDLPVVVERALIDQATELVQVQSKGAVPKWTVHRFDQQAGIPASVNLADLTTVVSRDGTYRAQAVYTIKNRTRQFLAIRLPEQTELLSVFVAEQASRAVTTQLASANGATVQLIALPKTSAASLSFPVKLVWSGRLKRALPKSSRLTRDELDIPAPHVIGQQEDAEFGIPVARTRWTVYLPSDLEAQASRSIKMHNMSLSDDNDRLYGQAIVQETSELLDFLGRSLISQQQRASRDNQKQIDLATSNLKQLEYSLNQYQYSSDEAFRKEKAEIMKRMSEIRRLASENEHLEESRRRGTPETAQGTVRLQGLSEGDLIANEQRNSLITSNGIAVQVEPSQTDFTFQRSDTLTLSARSTKSAKGPLTPSTQESKNDNRARLRSLNDSNIDSLNTTVTNNGLVRQQSRGLQQRSIQMNNQDESLAPSQSFANGIRNDMDRDKTSVRKDRAGATPNFDGARPAQQSVPVASDEERMETDNVSSLFGIALGGRAAGQVMAQQPAVNDPLAGGMNSASEHSARGLSLGIELPLAGQKVVFSKVGGDPKLAILVRSQAALRSGIGFLWSIVWIAAGILVLMALRQPMAKVALGRLAPFLASTVGLIGVCTLPMPLNLASLVLLVVGIVQLSRHNQSVAPAAK
ncbi:hypothetical protein [Schlesneria paludicola]|uniref:hypothetical protein n=1 Tax=Schlesneria paludicola TaxID=360056 RepID=UPI00029A7174|nr:hypothetical protein [Schlesneria paludicola]